MSTRTQTQLDVLYLTRHGVKPPQKPHYRASHAQWAAYCSEVSQQAYKLCEALIVQEEAEERDWLDLLKKLELHVHPRRTPRKQLGGNR